MYIYVCVCMLTDMDGANELLPILNPSEDTKFFHRLGKYPSPYF